MSPRAIGEGAAPAAWPIHVAMAAVIRAHDLFAFASGARVYNMQAPPDSPLPYYVLGTTSDDRFATFMRRGHRTTVDVHAWHHDTLTLEGILAMHAALCQAFDGTVLALEGHRFCRGRVHLVTTLPEPDAQATHGIFRYEVDTQWSADG